MANESVTRHPALPASEEFGYNLANQEHRYRKGYPRLAFFFSRFPRYLHLRRFTALATRILLYRQHELIFLEKRLLDLEERDARDNDPNKQSYSTDFQFLKTGPEGTNKQLDEQHKLYEKIKHELKEYEEAALRFEQLASKERDVIQLQTIQHFLSNETGNELCLSGIDADVWGSSHDSSGHAADIIQIVQQAPSSALGNFLQRKCLLWISEFPVWLHYLLFWSKKQADVYGLYHYSARTFETFSLTLGNVIASLLVYAAVTILYLTSGIASSIATVVLIAVAVTLCSALFRNAHFVSMLSTVCAVLVTLLNNDRNGHSFSGKAAYDKVNPET